ncbi:MAG: glycosyltransferase family 2 protein [Armatimonadetes bacterium]|nr:glycosyltransferase family 2 protein [Armatimonadota bacterium]
MDLSVVVLNWNAGEDLRRCLQSLTPLPSEIEMEVLVVDNASSDSSRAMVANEFPGARLIVNKTNLGFCAGNNAALPYVMGRWVLFLNPDTVVHLGALAAMVQYGDAHSEVGIIGPKLLNPDGSLQYSCRQFPDLAAGFFRKTPLGRLYPKNRYAANYIMSDWDHCSTREVDWLSGAAMITRKSLLDEIGAFDEDYYMFCEDVDLCYRAWKSGWKVVYLPEAVITHRIGRSTDQVPVRSTYLFHRSMYLFYRKHYRSKIPIAVRPIILPGIVLRAVGQIVRYRVVRWFRRAHRWMMKR